MVLLQLDLFVKSMEFLPVRVSISSRCKVVESDVKPHSFLSCRYCKKLKLPRPVAVNLLCAELF